MKDETREQIDNDAEKAAFRVPYNGTNEFYDEAYLKAWTAGATHQHPIAHAEGVKDGWRQAIEEALIEVEHLAMGVVNTQHDYSIIKAVKQKLEKLKL